MVVAAVAVGNSFVSLPVGIGVSVAWAVVNTDSADTLNLAHFRDTVMDARTNCYTLKP